MDGKLELAWVNTPLPPVAVAKKDPADEAMGDGNEEDEVRDEEPPRREERQVNMDYELADDEAWGE